MGKIDELIQQYCPEGVEYVPIGDYLSYEQPTRYLVESTKYDDSYTTPVLTAGQSFILGYTKETSGIFDASRNNPVIIFDDFTTSFHWVEFSFKVKSSAMKMLRPTNESKALFRYLYHCMKNVQYVPGDHTRQWIGTYSQFEIPLPPLPVQEAIVNILDRFAVYAAELQAELQARQQQYNYYRDTLLSFEGREDVQWKKLGEVCAKTDNIKWKTTTGTYQYIDLSSVDIQTHSILSTTPIDKSSAPSRAQQIVRENDVIFATTRPTQMRVCIVPSKYDGEICSTGFCVLRPNKEIVLPQYLFFALAVDDFRAYLSNNLTQGNYPSISNNTLKEYLLPIPSIEEQQHIVDILDRFDTLVNDLSQGLPAEIEARQQQYEYYRDQLLTFKRKEA